MWLDTTAKLIVRTLCNFFVFKKSLQNCPGSQKEAHDSKQVFPRGPKKRPMTPKIWHGTWNHDMAWHGATQPPHPLPARPCCCVQGGPVPCYAMSWLHVPCHIFGVMGLFLGPLGKKKLETWASFLDP